jgi:superfamily I DNA and/or RNA helicase
MDGSNTQSDSWGYRVRGKNQHVQWLDCKYNDYRNTNSEEGKIICDELIKFIDWAKDHRRDEGPYEVILLTFYVAQKRLLSKMVTKKLYKKEEEKSFISFDNVNIKINTVDYIQGQEADIVFLSMVRNRNIGFMDTPNRLNVGITRARHNMVFVGNYGFFSMNTISAELKQIARNAMGANE